MYKPGDFDETVSTYVVEVDGRLHPMTEWEDHPMQYADCQAGATSVL
jgi:hypothetical protein